MLDVGGKKLLCFLFICLYLACLVLHRSEGRKKKSVLTKTNNCQVFRMEIIFS